MAREKVNDIVLMAAAKAADRCIDLSLCFLDPYGVRNGKYREGPSLVDNISRRAAQNAIQRLKNNGCLEKIESSGKTLYRITEAGRSKLEKTFFDREIWDGKWRIVTYDIPEENKKTRDRLRTLLGRCRFKQLQKSVWISPFDVLGEIEEFATDNDIHQNIWYFKSDSLKNDENIIEMFINKEE